MPHLRCSPDASLLYEPVDDNNYQSTVPLIKSESSYYMKYYEIDRVELLDVFHKLYKVFRITFARF